MVLEDLNKLPNIITADPEFSYNLLNCMVCLGKIMWIKSKNKDVMIRYVEVIVDVTFTFQIRLDEVIIIRDQTVADLTRFSQITHTCPDRTNLFIWRFLTWVIGVKGVKALLSICHPTLLSPSVESFGFLSHRERLVKQLWLLGQRQSSVVTFVWLRDVFTLSRGFILHRQVFLPSRPPPFQSTTCSPLISQPICCINMSAFLWPLPAGDPGASQDNRVVCQGSTLCRLCATDSSVSVLMSVCKADVKPGAWTMIQIVLFYISFTQYYTCCKWQYVRKL